MRFALINAITEEAHATGLLVLHLDRSNRGHYVAAARLDDDVTLPEHCQPRLDLVNLDPASAPDLQALVGAVIAAAEDTDRQAWSEWAQQEVTAKRLAPGVAEAILQSVTNTQSEAIWKQSLYKRRPYVICRARLRTDLLDNWSLAMLLEISKRLIYWTLVSGQPLREVVSMDENACLNELCSSKGARRIVVSAWEAQITDALVWNTCCEAVATGDDARLHRWRTAIAIAQNALHPQDVSAASAFLDCAKLTLKAKALGDEKNPARQTHTAEDTRIALLHAAMQVLGLACHCDVDHGQLGTSSMTQRIFGQGDAVDEAGSMVAAG